MPGLFSRRRSSASNHVPLDRSTYSNASAAANSAYLQRNPSSTSLSSAAAAAALRSLTTTPEPIANIQTKRMVRRASVTSVGSGSVISNSGGRPTLSRQNSNGSMVDRTFRSPSPGPRSNGRALPTPAAWDAPPVPKLPKTLRKGGHQRASSVTPPPRVTSPTPPKGGRSASVDHINSPPPLKYGKKRLSNVNEMAEEEEARRSSINFSRPIPSPQASPATSTPPKHFTHGGGGWFSRAEGTGMQAGARPGPRPKTTDFTGAQVAVDMQQTIQNAVTKPTPKKKLTQPAEGSHLAQTRVASQTRSPPQEEMETTMVFDANSRTFVPKLVPKKIQPQSPSLPKAEPLKPGQYDPSTRSIVPHMRPNSATSSSRLSSRPTTPGAEPMKKVRAVAPPAQASLQVPTSTPPRASGVLQNQPSPVREIPKGDEEEASSPQGKSAIIQPSEGPGNAYVTPTRTLSPSRGRGNGRVQSLSPHRARFSAAPVVDTAIHVPPGRGVSPVKSAMKNSPASSIRTSSPMAYFGAQGPKGPSSETSDTQSSASPNGAAKKKKSVRVSFDEHAQEFDYSPITPPMPQRSSARAVSPALVDDMEEIMTPRPALPSFGSVRKNRPVQDIDEKVTEMPPERHETSSDHAIGGILADAKNRTASDPVPPEVTSKEGAESIGDYSEDEFDMTAQTAGSMNGSGLPKARDFATDPTKNSANIPLAESENVPAINLLPPTPGLEEQRVLGEDGDGAVVNPKNSMDGIDVPGGWTKEEEITDQRTAPITLSEVVAVSNDAGSSGLGEDELDPSLLPTLDAITEDSDDSAAFSDAAEDLSDLDDGGFASLDAIANSPIVPHSTERTPRAVSPARPIATVSPPESPSTRQAEKLLAKAHKSGGSGDWTEATAYWSQLSKKQRQQIEQEHANSDSEMPTPEKPVAKKSALKKPAAATAPVPASTPTAPKSDRVATTQPIKSALKKTMRAQPEPTPASTTTDSGVHMRRTMRGTGGAGGMMGSLRDGPRASQRPQSALVEAKIDLPRPNPRRPISAHIPSPDSPPVTLPPGSAFPFIAIKANPAQPIKHAQPKPSSVINKQQIEKAPAYDSDSESSFKKKRRPTSTVDASGRYSMKRSMRSNSAVDETAAPPRRPMSPDGLSMRAKSPNGSMFSARKSTQMRESLRSRSVDPSAGRMTLRNGPQNRGGNNSRPAPASARSSKFKSRFNDSDDEDEPKSSFFRSRFVDSDEEDGPQFIAADLTVVRGIPRKQGQYDGDSTDLDDSEDEDPRKAFRKRNKQPKPIVPDPADVEKAMEAARKKLGIAAIDTHVNGREGTALHKGSLRASQDPGASPELTQLDSTKKKRGFMGSLLRRNRGSSMSVQQSPALPQSPSSPQGIQQNLPGSPSSLSGGRKLIRRNSHQTPAPLIRGDSNYSTMTAPPGISAASDWPLSTPPVPSLPHVNGTAKAVAKGGRPVTADGVSIEAIRLARTMHSNLQSRTASGQNFAGSRVRILGPDDDAVSVPGEAPDDEPRLGSPYSKTGGKKKKFGMLRKAFRLDD
ncbi:Hypothetical protein R9X50_00800100 [Acrodontium crateriforme]|uniref:Uncharacterized protein n=1 Tax=Acrodontium crateriforme TaxID=150365 RepID=A0AAQ3RD45_9PEZI|nr:Hypothetical protein R9X50_00800100 [Acrodontium crateriforme]